MLGWGLVSFSTRSVEAPPEDVIPVDIIDGRHSKMTQGIKSGKKENPKPLAEKVAEAKPVDDAVGKIDKKDVVTHHAPEPTPKPVEKPVEKKPDPPKPVPRTSQGRAEAGREEAGREGRSIRSRRR